MVNRDNLHLVVCEPVNDAITVNEDFTQLATAKLWDNTTQTGKLGQSVNNLEHLHRKYLGIPWGITRYEQANSVQVI